MHNCARTVTKARKDKGKKLAGMQSDEGVYILNFDGSPARVKIRKCERVCRQSCQEIIGVVGFVKSDVVCHSIHDEPVLVGGTIYRGRVRHGEGVVGWEMERQVQ